MMRQKLKEQPIEAEFVEDNGCHHHWIIEAANGPTSEGTCRHCGQKRIFSNSMPAMNPLKRGPAPKANPFDLPEMQDVAIEGDSKS